MGVTCSHDEIFKSPITYIRRRSLAIRSWKKTESAGILRPIQYSKFFDTCKDHVVGFWKHWQRFLQYMRAFAASRLAFSHSEVSQVSQDSCEEQISDAELQESTKCWVLRPDQCSKFFDMYQKQKASFWTPEEIDLTKDSNDWVKLSDKEQHFIKHVLAFFAASDGIVLENLAVRFLTEVQNSELRSFYAFQIAMENIHSETYGLLIDEFVKDTKEKDLLFEAVRTIPAVKVKAAWTFKWIRSTRSFAERLLAFACVEGILFSGSFCAIYWLKKRGLMPGLTFSNELIARDEGLHADFACALYEELGDKLPEDQAGAIVDDAVNVERKFICESLPYDLPGMNSTLMLQYIKFVADRLLQALGYSRRYNVTNPFDWMEMISLQGKTNFFEKRVSDYQRAYITSAKHEHIFTTTAEF